MTRTARGAQVTAGTANTAASSKARRSAAPSTVPLSASSWQSASGSVPRRSSMRPTSSGGSLPRLAWRSLTTNGSGARRTASRALSSPVATRWTAHSRIRRSRCAWRSVRRHARRRIGLKPTPSATTCGRTAWSFWTTSACGAPRTAVMGRTRARCCRQRMRSPTWGAAPRRAGAASTAPLLCRWLLAWRRSLFRKCSSGANNRTQGTRLRVCRPRPSHPPLPIRPSRPPPLWHWLQAARRRARSTTGRLRTPSALT
mmetsp:Transcript_50284/g.116735  ORF Transcript_50284/g.116735 Transcript_50284/m.116735 type:complete len:257 (+) Transcript_50284:317-1087(+)